MNTVKSYKFILIISLAIISLVMALATMSIGFAQEEVLPSNYFEYDDSTTAAFKDDNAVFTVTENDTIKLKNEIAVNDFSVDLILGNGIKDVEIIITTPSFFVNGNKNTEGKYDKAIKNTAKVTDSGKVVMTVGDDGFYDVTVNDVAQVEITDKYYRVKPSNDYNVLVGFVEFNVTLNDGVETADFEIVSISQKASDDAYLQTFKLTEGALTDAKPIITISDNMKVIDDNGEDKVVVSDAKITKIEYSVYSILSDNVKSNTTIKANGWVDDDNDVHFNTSVTEFKIVDKIDNDKVLSTVKVKVLDHTAKDDKAPEYVGDEDALNAFKKALEDKYTVVDDNDTPDDTSDDVTHCVSIGTIITIPSLKDLVSDNYTSYANLDYTVYYATPDSSEFSTQSNLDITLTTAGKYVFFVVFADKDGNTMEKSQFIKEEEGKEDVINTAELGAFVFDFYIEDNAPISITAASQSKGYKGTSYTASKFKVDANNCTITYKLYYNKNTKATKDSVGWVEIPKKADITDVDYNKNGYTYDRIQSIAYNGSLTFTPDRMGSYMIECIANSKTTAREAIESAIIRVEENAVTVKPASEWLENNVWSVVFLSIGTLCLIGIIILLCIKPKDVKED